ncbi:MAG: transcription antitermination factor NusB [Deltaproteobacteria bacterium]|nr:transcription antitermination factor NusB [Deltaproteobacteria bacterium]
MTSKVSRRALGGTARERAAEVLLRVEEDKAYAAPALAVALERAPALVGPDRGLCTEIVYGVLRSQRAIDQRIRRHITREGSYETLDGYVRALLRVATYEILGLERVPPRASVHAAVESITRDRSKGLGGFANALLRKLAQERVEGPLDAQRLALAMDSVHPSVRKEFADALGSDSDAGSVLAAMLGRTMATHVRVEATQGTVDSLIEKLTQERPRAVITRGALARDALHVSGAGDLRDTEAYREGLFAVQEEGAQAVGLALDVQPGQRVLDVCAGRGGKSALLASLMGSQGVLHACDLYPEKLARGRDELARLGLLREGLTYEAHAADLTRGWGTLEAHAREGYDRVLVDAPCSGLGTLARRPELLLRRESGRGEREELGSVQRGILLRSAGAVRVGGTLVYAVCTLTREEGEGMCEWFLREHPGFELADAGEGVSERLRAARVLLRPDRDGSDGFVLWRVKRVR